MAMSQHEDIIGFLNKYTLNYVDPHTTIVMELMAEDRGQAFDEAMGKEGRQRMPVCYLVKDMIVEDEEGQLGSVLDTLAIHQQLSNKYILTLIHHQIFLKSVLNDSSLAPSQSHHQSQQYESEPNDSHRKMESNTKMNNEETILNQNKKAIRAIYQYGKLTLKEQIGNRIASSTLFEEEELWAIMATIVQALGYLQQQGIVYGVLGTDKIFINDSLVKILDPSATATDPLLIAQGRLYSPEILNDEQNINMFKSDVYISGLIILECGLLVDLSKQVEPDLSKYLNEFKQNYSPQLVELIEMCLEAHPQERPSFEDLKKYLAKQLDMNDFQSAYDNTGVKILKPLVADVEDSGNPAVVEIQMEYEECNCDILYQSIGEEQVQRNYKQVTEYDRARIRYLGIHVNSGHNERRCAMEIGKEQGNGQRAQSQQHRHTSSSPVQTRRNSKKGKNLHPNGEPYPTFNMAISESVYDNEMMPITFNNDKTNRKNQKNEYYFPEKNRRQEKENQNVGQQRTLPNTNQKIKKTKLIKEKLVKNCDEGNVDHTFGDAKRHFKNNGGREREIAFENERRAFERERDNRYGQSIQQEQEQESESSYLYYNTVGSSKASKRPPKPNSCADSQISKRSEGSQNMKASSKGSSRYLQCDTKNLQYSSSRTELVQDQLFTDPNLMQTIKQDLARISTTKNVQIYSSSDNRWFK